MKQDGIGRERNHKRLLISQNKLGLQAGEGVGVMDIGEGICYEVYKPGDSQTCTPGANNTLYANKKLKIF